MQNQTLKPKLYILNTRFTGVNYQLLPKYILKQLRQMERTFPQECRNLEWDVYSNCNRWILTFWDNGHTNTKFLVNHIIPCIDNNGYREEISRKPKVIIYINKL